MTLNRPLLICAVVFWFTSFDGVERSLSAQAVANGEAQSKWDPTWIDARVAAWQPTESERAFDKIGWVRELSEAERLAQEHQRPVFLFTYDGSDLACFRC